MSNDGRTTAATRRRLGGPRPRIAFLVDWLEDPYQGDVMRGAVEEAERRGVSLFVVGGGILGGTTRNGAHRNFVYDLGRDAGFDGAIVMSGTMGNELGIGSVEQLVGRLGEIPLCSIGAVLPDRAALRVDNVSGMKSGVEHLIEVHGYRRIAFIRGPAVNAEAEARYGAYREALSAHEIAFDESWVLPGDFQRGGGRRAIATLLDERGVSVEDLDAVVAATDLMAMGAMDALGDRGLRVPGDVAVLGFDDLEESRYASPPLASVRQPLSLQGAEALRLVLAQLGAATESGERVLATTFVPRRSCGCLPHEEGESLERSSLGSGLSLEANLIRKRDVLLAEMSRSVRGELLGGQRDWEVRLFRALQDQFRLERESQAEPLKDAVDELLVTSLEAGGDVAVGHRLVSAIRRQLWLCTGDDPGKIRAVEDAMHGCRIVISALLERSQARGRLQADAWARQIARASGRLASAPDEPTLRERLAELLPALGIRLCLAFRFIDSEAKSVELSCGWAAESARDALLRDHPKAAARDIVPEQLISREQATRLIVLPLADESKTFGYVVFDAAPVPGYTFEVLRELLTGAMLHLVES